MNTSELLLNALKQAKKEDPRGTSGLVKDLGGILKRHFKDKQISAQVEIITKNRQTQTTAPTSFKEWHPGNKPVKRVGRVTEQVEAVVEDETIDPTELQELNAEELFDRFDQDIEKLRAYALELGFPINEDQAVEEQIEDFREFLIVQ